MNIEKAARFTIAAIALAGLIIETVSVVQRGVSMVQFLSYFTIQSNIFITVYFFASLSERRLVLNSPTFHGLALVNISTTGIIFYLLLHDTYHPTGMSYYSNIIQHFIVPIAAVLDFILFRKRGPYHYQAIMVWLSYAVTYLVYTLVRGSIIDRYPYPFLDLTKLALSAVVLNILAIACAFLVYSLLLVFFDRKFRSTS